MTNLRLYLNKLGITPCAIWRQGVIYVVIILEEHKELFDRAGLTITEARKNHENGTYIYKVMPYENV